MFTPNNETPKKPLFDTLEVSKSTEYRVVKMNPDTTSPNLEVIAIDAPGSGGANHHYKLHGFNLTDNPSLLKAQGSGNGFSTVPKREINIFFQNGPVLESAFNGVTIEMLLAVCKDRLESFQAGPFASGYNGSALIHINAALGSLDKRTYDRKARNVEGKSVV